MAVVSSDESFKTARHTAYRELGTVGYLNLTARGRAGDTVTIGCGQELSDDGTVRTKLRCNCEYVETWVLADGESTLEQYDYKSFRFAELTLPSGTELTEVYLIARHYPFKLAAKIKPEYASDERLVSIWELCVHTQRYGVQEVIQDCMDREKGFYVGDGCFTALTNMVLTGNDSMVRKLIDDAFASSFITDGLVTCLDCSFMQEIAEYPLIMVYLIMWHFRLIGDIDYLRVNYENTVKLLEAYRRDYERDGVLCDLDKWCVVDWPMSFRDGYAVDITEGQVCHEPHVSINAYYIEAVRYANKMARLLGVPDYRDETPFVDAFIGAFYDAERHIFVDGAFNDHVSIIGNVFPYAFELCPDDECRGNITAMISERKVSSMSFFGSFAAMIGLVRHGEDALVREMLLDDGAWLRILREGGTTTYEGWGRDTKWNTSLFHLTMSYAAIFLADIDHAELFK